MANICVFCSSSSEIEKKYLDAAEELGKLIGKGGHTLIYGGSDLGTMGILAKSVQANGGKVIGIIPEHLQTLAKGEDELVTARNMYHRKEIMESKADIFIALPGGIGTIDEIFDILVGKQLKIHEKPLIIINLDNYYEDLIKQINKINQLGFVSLKFDIKEVGKIFYVVNTPKEAMDYIDNILS
ncbi:MAG: TIGR00730 family Rossman fold protein [archaeon]